MQVLLESKNDLEKTENAFGSKEELVDILETAQDNNNTLSPIEVATLQLTMRQIDKGMDLPATESYHTSPEFFTTLAVESLKENIQGKWEAFVKAIKAIFKKIKEMAVKAYERMKSKFKRKAGDKNSHFTRDNEKEENTDTEEGNVTQDKPKPEVNSYTLDRSYIDMDNRADIQTMLERLEYTHKLLSLTNVMTGRHGGIHTSILQSQANMGAPEALRKSIQSNSQEVMEMLEEAGGKLKGHSMILTVSETVAIVMKLEDYTSFPAFVIETGQEVVIELPTDRQNFGDKLAQANSKLIDASLRWFKEISKLPGDEVTLEKVTDPESRAIVMKLAKLYSNRLKLTADMSKLVDGLTSIAGGIAADIKG